MHLPSTSLLSNKHIYMYCLIVDQEGFCSNKIYNIYTNSNLGMIASLDILLKSIKQTEHKFNHSWSKCLGTELSV